YFVLHNQIKNTDYGSIEAEYDTYFETFEELAKFLENDLSNCDLSKAILPDIDWSVYKMGEHTKLPIQYQKNLSYTVNKKYDRQLDRFVVEQSWKNEYGALIKNYNHSFKYFFDFVHYLKNDLSDADLLFCDGLNNISDFNDLFLNGARLKSNVLDKLGITYDLAFNETAVSFPIIQKNEMETVNALTTERMPLSFEEVLKNQKVFYVSDLHLLHRLENANCKSLNDAICLIQKVIDNLLKNIDRWWSYTVLIGGDTSSNLSLFELFTKTLRTSIDEKNLEVQVVFTLGNHELWDFSGTQFSEIVEKYRKLLTDNKMYLLQNNLLFKYDWNSIEEISTDELKRLSKEELRNRLIRARLILFGGIGFAGYNEEFNANKFIYRNALNRNQEIEESKKFEELYEKVCECLYEKRVVVFTHMPQKDWCSNNEPHKGFVYVNGHTHRNLFYDDGDYRIYADNQIGYHQENCRLKYFYLEDDYDIFEDYQDGIYEITREEYIDFYRGKNIAMDFNRDGYNIFMLKKSDYYCFIAKSNKGYLLILNGGNLKRLEHKDINYYFENIDKVISYIKTPLDKFTDYQKQIANEIKVIGGSGTIHGAIIDIDFFNHIFVNPLDLKTTAYWASDIVNKKIFNDTPTLLQHNCPTIYANYLKLIESKSENAIILKKSEIVKMPSIYLDTDIYRASMEIKKMQKLSSNILSIWIEPEVKKLSN
ncbi:MAG: metallophosphoesterase, partial [Clostridia bacterium]|nr:metallophosphoesterase [Clostridia bacterium]